MRELNEQSKTQLENIEKSTGISFASFVDLVRDAGLTKHGAVVSYLKSEHGLTHGNANLISLLVREELSGGPATPESLLEAQYSGAKAALRPIFDALASEALSLGADAERVVQKTGVSFRRHKQFALVQVPSSKRITLGLNLPQTPSSPRASESTGMCTHQVVLTSESEIDDEVRGWMRDSYENC